MIFMIGQCKVGRNHPAIPAILVTNVAKIDNDNFQASSSSFLAKNMLLVTSPEVKIQFTAPPGLPRDDYVG